MSFCRHCGHNNEHTQAFCVKCGNPVTQNEKTPNINKDSIKEKELQTITQHTGKSFWRIAFVILIIVIVTILFIRKCSISSNNDDISQNSSNEIEVLTYDFSPLKVSNEIIPVLCSYYNNIGQPILTMQISNKSSSLQKFEIKVEIPEFSNLSQTTYELQPSEIQTFNIPLTFKCKFYQINEIVNTQLNICIIKEGKDIYRETKPINIASKGTMIWSYSSPYDMMELIAGFVNPNDPNIEKIVSDAKELKYDRRFIGYQIQDPYEQALETKEQMKSIFLALRNIGTSYVNSTLTFASGHTQRVRTPSESIENKQANCIDGAVLFASLFENIGLEPLIIIGPQHAFVAVRQNPGSNECYFLETTVTGSTNEESVWDWFTYTNPDENLFEKALTDGRYTYSKWYNDNTFEIVDIKTCRKKHILPSFSCN